MICLLSHFIKSPICLDAFFNPTLNLLVSAVSLHGGRVVIMFSLLAQVVPTSWLSIFFSIFFFGSWGWGESSNKLPTMQADCRHQQI